jgi:UPF0716 family protein affecting phage T7 exclusion
VSPIMATLYSFLFGLLHGVLPDEHTWPITFSYAIGGASGRRGMRAGLLFSAAFTVQRTLLSEVAYLALAPFLLSPTVNGTVYAAVGLAMAAAGYLVLGGGAYPHLHLVGHHHEEGRETGSPAEMLHRRHRHLSSRRDAPPAHWTIVHGFIAGFGFGGFSAFVNTVAAPAMGSPYLGFLPGLVFGLGTMLVLVVLGGLLGASLRWTGFLRADELRRVGALTGGRTLLYGGLLFVAAGVLQLSGVTRSLPVDTGSLLIAAFLAGIAVPALVFSAREVLRERQGRAGAAGRPGGGGPTEGRPAEAPAGARRQDDPGRRAA